MHTGEYGSKGTQTDMAKFPRHKLATLDGDETYEQLAETAKSTKVLDKPPTALKPADIHAAPRCSSGEVPGFRGPQVRTL